MLEGTRPAQAIEEANQVGPATPPPSADPPAAAPTTGAQAGIEPSVANLLGYLFLGIGGLVVS